MKVGGSGWGIDGRVKMEMNKKSGDSPTASTMPRALPLEFYCWSLACVNICDKEEWIRKAYSQDHFVLYWTIANL